LPQVLCQDFVSSLVLDDKSYGADPSEILTDAAAVWIDPPPFRCNSFGWRRPPSLLLYVSAEVARACLTILPTDTVRVIRKGYARNIEWPEGLMRIHSFAQGIDDIFDRTLHGKSFKRPDIILASYRADASATLYLANPYWRREELFIFESILDDVEMVSLCFDEAFPRTKEERVVSPINVGRSSAGRLRPVELYHKRLEEKNMAIFKVLVKCGLGDCVLDLASAFLGLAGSLLLFLPVLFLGLQLPFEFSNAILHSSNRYFVVMVEDEKGLGKNVIYALYFRQR
jgi:hypothetical protein